MKEELKADCYYLKLDGERAVMAGVVPDGQIGIRIERPIMENEDLEDVLERAKTTTHMKDGRLVTSFLLSEEAADALIAVLMKAVDSKHQPT